MIAIIGAAGEIPSLVRTQAAALARGLSEAGFDLVTGGMDGVMRAVAHGHARADAGTNLVHIESGEGRPWLRNPHPASVVRTDMGSMRNHLVVRSADLVVAVAGGAGTLSELAIAWQERKPAAALRSTGGWSERLAGAQLDERRRPPIADCASVDDVLAWAEALRPRGVFGGRANQGFFPLEVPALHRVHEGAPSSVHQVHMRYGMSIAKTELVRRLRELDDRVANWNRQHRASAVALVTFDDGWKDVLCLQDAFLALPYLCPVLFVGENHFETPIRPLPLQRLYQHCAERGLDPEDETALGAATRSRLKKLAEADQHALLGEHGVAAMQNPDWLLTPRDLAQLADAGWVVASHGHCHEDLPRRGALREELAAVAEALEERGHAPWLCWPEGCWSPAAWARARDAGLRFQFALAARTGPEPLDGVAMRTIWR